jgi:hypothetical protein
MDFPEKIGRYAGVEGSKRLIFLTTGLFFR